MSLFTSRPGLAVLLGTVLVAGPIARSEEARELSRGVGQAVADFRLPDAATGEVVELEKARGSKATVIVFLGTDCPLVNLYLPRLVELERKYGPAGVKFLGINSNLSEPAEVVARQAKEAGLSFPVLKDAGSVVADQLQALRTCEALVLDSGGVLRYRGAIDDQYVVGRQRASVRKAFVSEALDALVAGQAIETSGTSVDGCPIERGATVAPKRDRVRAATPAVVAAYEEVEGKELPDVGKPTYAGQVAKILQERCQSCHRPGEVGPFALGSYEDAKRWASGIHEVVEDRRMPPWHADPRYGHFENDRHLTPVERATLLTWVEDECPAGDLAQAPAARPFTEGWTIGHPDLVFSLPEPYTVQAEGVLEYQRFHVDPGFQEDVWVNAAEARPGDRSVVHHIIVYVQPPGSKWGEEGMHLCGYAPGDMPSMYPAGVAKRIPAGSKLMFEVHYTPIGKVRVDRSSVGLALARCQVEREAVTRPIAQGKFEIPPGAANHEVRSGTTLKQDILLLSFMPHMHLRGKDFLYRAKYADGRVETLLSVPAYDFNWQSYYRLAEPKLLPKGTRIECVAHYDNSAGNPFNPDPTKAVRWGDQTFEEMMIGYIDYMPAKAKVEVKAAAGE